MRLRWLPSSVVGFTKSTRLRMAFSAMSTNAATFAALLSLNSAEYSLQSVNSFSMFLLRLAAVGMRAIISLNVFEVAAASTASQSAVIDGALCPPEVLAQYDEPAPVRIKRLLAL